MTPLLSEPQETKYPLYPITSRERFLRIATGLILFSIVSALVFSLFSPDMSLPARQPASLLSTEAITESGGLSKPSASRESIVATPVETLVISDKTSYLLPRSFTGVLAARQSSELAFKLNGRVEKMMVDQGDSVKKGQVLAELDTASLEANLAVLKAKRNAADSRLRELVAGPRRQTINAAKAQLKEIESLRDLAQATYDRRIQLQASDAISKQDIDDARLQLSATEGRYDAQVQVLSELEEGTRSEQIDAQKAVVEQIDASIRSLNIELDESVLRSPFDAIVARRMADEGTVVAPGATVFKVVDHASPEAWIGVPPDLSDELKIGEKHSLRLGKKTLTGTIKAFLPELDPVSRTQTIIFEVDPEANQVPASGENDIRQKSALGQIVQLDMMREVTQAGYWLPLSALSRGNRGLWLAYTVVPESDPITGEAIHVLRQCFVEIVQIDSSHVFVRGTLKSGDRIVAAGIQKLTTGQRVQFTDQEAS